MELRRVWLVRELLVRSMVLKNAGEERRVLRFRDVWRRARMDENGREDVRESRTG